MYILTGILVTLILGIFFLFSFAYLRVKKAKAALEKKETAIARRMYELAILKELGERIGYSLNIQQIIDVITGSLHQFIEYSAVSYMFLEPEKIIFKVHLEQSVSRQFIDDVQNRMLKSLSALLDKQFTRSQVNEIVSGAIIVDELSDPVNSFFNIPLVIGNKVVGVLTIAHTKIGLYKEEEMTILYKITQQASNAVTRLQDVVSTEQRKLNAMVESMSEGVIMTDRDFRVLVANPAAKRAVQLEGKAEVSIFDFIDHLEGKFDIRGRLEESVQLDKVIEAREVLIKDRFFQIFVSPVKNTSEMSGKNILGGVVIFHDITHEKEIEKLREDFTSMMVHELRSPLDNIKKISEVIKTGEVVADSLHLKEYIHLIYTSSSQMLELVSDLLDAAKLESGRFEVFKKPGSIPTLIAERVAFFENSAKEAHIEFRTEISHDVPQDVSFDATRITQVLNNLISNSLKFTSAGGKVTIQSFLHQKEQRVSDEEKKQMVSELLTQHDEQLKSAGDYVVVAVSDTGRGIARADIERLFHKFKQFGHQEAPISKRGTGLGLVIAKGIVEAHGGGIGVISQEGSGSTFYFTLPLHLQNK